MGSRKGSPNSRTQDLFEITQRLGCNPFEVLIHFVKGDHEALGIEKYQVVSVTKYGEPIEKLSIPPELRQKSAKDACEYLFPKRKAIEISTEEDDPLKAFVEALSGSK
jgi:hypothetical protein